MLIADEKLNCIEAEDSEILEVLRSDRSRVLDLPGVGDEPIEIYVVVTSRAGRSEVFSAAYVASRRSIRVFRLPAPEVPAAGYRNALKQVISYWEGYDFKFEPVKINYAKAMREVVIRSIPVIMSPLALRKLQEESNRPQSRLTRKDHAASSGEMAGTAKAVKESAPVVPTAAAICEAEEVANQEDAAARKLSELAARKQAAAEVARKQAEEAARKEAEEAARQQAEDVARRQAEEAAAAALKQAEAAAREKAAEEEARKKAAEEAAQKQAAEEEARKKAAEEEARKKAAEEEARKKAAEEAAQKQAAEEEARKQAAEEEARKQAAEEEARKQAAEAAARKKAAEEAARKKAAEETAQKQAAEEEARKQAAEAAARKKAAEDEARKQAAEAAARKKAAEEEARKQAAAAAARKQAAEAAAATRVVSPPGEKLEERPRAKAHEAAWQQAEDARKKAEEAARSLTPQERAALIIERESKEARVRAMVDEAAALLLGGGGETKGHAPGIPGESFTLVPGLETLTYAQPMEVAELYISLSMVVLSPENYPQQHCSAYICTFHRQGKVELYVVLRLRDSRRSLFYTPRRQPANMQEYRQQVAAAVRFLEVTGFLVEPTPLGSTPEERKKSLAVMPFLTATGT
ncbi:MAG: hypothetical protein A2005_03580 [Desulfuromonadales bacterium GWC2_61_20]|nr:MAG: hypothetical protein A2005_03580 [Desulfuromonadales bacterium GWC2_61_20]